MGAAGTLIEFGGAPRRHNWVAATGRVNSIKFQFQLVGSSVAVSCDVPRRSNVIKKDQRGLNDVYWGLTRRWLDSIFFIIIIIYYYFFFWNGNDRSEPQLIG